MIRKRSQQNINRQPNLYQCDVKTVFEQAKSNPQGLSFDEVAKRQAEYGPNQLEKIKGEPLIVKLAKNFLSLMAILLWIGGAVAFFFAGTPELGIAIWLVNVINGCFSFFQEYKAGKATEALEHMLPSYARVTRQNQEEKILAQELVPGDLMMIEEGDSISADARIISATDDFQVNQSALTGESNPVTKNNRPIFGNNPDLLSLDNLVFAGTSVSKGNAKVLVTNIGMATEFGQIAHLTQGVTNVTSPLQKELNRLTKQISLIAISVGIFFLLTSVLIIKEPLAQAFVFALGMIVAFIPEGLLPTVTLSLAMAVQKMAKKNALVKTLASVETLGETSVICSDKTGTLTQNEMTVNHIWTLQQEYDVTGLGYAPQGTIQANQQPIQVSDIPSLNWLIRGAALCGNASIEPPHGDQTRYTVLGDPTEACLSVLAQKAGIDLTDNEKTAPRLHELSFDSERKRMTTIHQLETELSGSRLISFTKGAPKEITELSSRIYDQNQIRPLTDKEKAAILKANDQYAKDGLRVLALACRQLDKTADLPQDFTDYSPEMIEQDLIFMGLLVMQDPARMEVAKAVEKCHKANIRIIMITGDYGLTALSIARKIGIVQGKNPRLITGQELGDLSDSELQAILKDEVVFARIAPEQKYRIVTNLQELGHVVAVTGDGVNDAPALKKADIGVAMGITGTDVAKSSADMILTDDNFASIVNAIEEGRTVYQNIKKFLTYIFNSNTSEAIPSASFLFSRGFIPLPLTVMQILAIDLGSDMLPALGLGIESAEKDIMERPPRRKSDALLTKNLLIKAFIWYGLLEACLAMGAFFFTYLIHGQGFAFNSSYYAEATTMTLGAIIFCQIGMVQNCRTTKQSVFDLKLFSNSYINLGMLAEILLFILLSYLPLFNRIFNTAPLEAVNWLYLILCPLPILALEEIRKAWLRKHPRK